MALIAPLNTTLKVEINGDQFLEIIKLQAAENAADRELLREGIQQLGGAVAGFLALQAAREERRAEEARAESLAHQVRLAEINKPEVKPRRHKKTAPSYMNGVNGVNLD
jgi:hypothetical protein